MQTRARVLLAVKAAVSVGLLGWLVLGIAEREGMDALATRLGALAPAPLVLAVALHFVAVLSGVARWRVLLDARGLGQPLPWLLRSFLIGRFVGAFTPSTTGLDGWRGYDVARRTGDLAGSASVLLVEKLFGLVGMAAVCAAVAPLGVLDRLGPGALPLALAIAAGAALGLFLLASPARTRALARLAPRALRGRVEKLAEALAAQHLSRGRTAAALALGIASHLAISAVFAATGAALGAPASFTTLLAVGNAITISVLLPVSIGGVGVREGVAVVLLAGAGVPASDAVLVALLGYVTGQVPALVGGVLLLLDRGAARGAAAVAAARADATV
jgi:glycosyltransferase 2 family protein